MSLGHRLGETTLQASPPQRSILTSVSTSPSFIREPVLYARRYKTTLQNRNNQQRQRFPLTAESEPRKLLNGTPLRAPHLTGIPVARRNCCKRQNFFESKKSTRLSLSPHFIGQQQNSPLFTHLYDMSGQVHHSFRRFVPAGKRRRA